MSDNKRIAKNTLYLYFRMIFTMMVSLFTSRIVLAKLGIDDYGLYNAVGGIVGFLSFLNGALSTGSSRFLTYELGAAKNDRLKRTFSTLLTAHALLALFIVIIAYTVGLFFLYDKLVIPVERFNSALMVYHISIATSVVTILQVPYNASIISHEKMNVFAYTSIFEVIAKLVICYLLGIGDVDKLVLYASYIFTVHIGLSIFNLFYCKNHFNETSIKLTWDTEILRPILSFSSWSLFADGTTTLSKQGILVLLNMFFPASVVAARSISLQVNSAANQLVQNFRVAVNPQIVKLYASEKYAESKDLLILSTKIAYYLMLCISIPIYFFSDEILHIWLGNNVPELTSIFLKIVVIQSLFQVFDRSFYVPLYAKGQLKENAIITPIAEFLAFPAVYILFKFGFSPIALSWAYLIDAIVIGLLIKPILLIKIVDYSFKDILNAVVPCLHVSLASIAIMEMFCHICYSRSFVSITLLSIVSIFFTIISAYMFGVSPKTRAQINNYLIKTVK